MLYNVILVTESWLNKNVPDSILDPNNEYTILRCDRGMNRIGGGVCVFVSKRLQVISIGLSELYPELEVCCFDLIFSDVKCRMFVVYRAPNSYHSERLLECLNLFSKVKHHSIITGDFNCGDIDWNTLAAPIDGVQDMLLNFSIANGFSQMIQSATRADKLLDLVFSNEPLGICNVNVSHPFGTSDHCQVEFSVFVDSTMQANDEPSAKRFDWNNADFDGISSYIATFNWLDMLATNLTPDSIWCAFSDVLHTAIDMYVPIKPDRNVAIKNRRWYPAALRHAISKKRSLCGRKRRDPNNVLLNAAYRAVDLKCRNLLRDYETKREQKVIERNNAGCFYRFVNNKLSCKRGLGALSDNKGGVIVSDAERADLLNNYFSSVCTTDNGTMPTVERSVPADVEIESIEFTPSKVHAAIKKT